MSYMVTMEFPEICLLFFFTSATAWESSSILEKPCASILREAVAVAGDDVALFPVLITI